MTSSELIQKLNLRVFCDASDKQVNSYYIGDLLSWVMSRAGDECCWLTIMSNLNVAAVAQLAEMSCVILCENVTPDQALLSKAVEEKINLFGTDKPLFEMASAISELVNANKN